jgi:hypothetical protein
MTEADYKSRVCDLIRGYAKMSASSSERVTDFLETNNLQGLEDCSDIKTIDLLCKIETFMAIEKIKGSLFGI